MKIAQVAPLYESVPPRLYGGTERIVHYLTEALTTLGHDVTLFASGDSQTSADLQPVIPEALRLAQTPRDPLAAHILEFGEVVRMASQFDIIHFHTDYLHFPLVRQLSIPHVTTLHGRLDLPHLPELYEEFHDIPVISISNSQRKPLPQAHWLTTVYNGVPATTYDFIPTAGNYLAFVGRVSPEKGLPAAIQIARELGIPLRIGAKVDPVDRQFYEEEIQPLLDDPLIEFIGEVDEQQKNELFGGALATLFPIAWPEPFGLVMIESMACGTPIVAFPQGSVPEVMREGVTGRIVADIAGAVQAVQHIQEIDRHGCRKYFEENFSAERMAQRYVQAYARICSGAPAGPPADLSLTIPRNGMASTESLLN